MTERRGRWRIWQIGVDVVDVAGNAGISQISASVAFFGMFALFPAMGAVIALFGLFADPVQVDAQLDLLREVIPQSALVLLHGQVAALLAARGNTLGWATGLSILVALWSARAGVGALMTGLTMIMGDPHRNMVHHFIVALGLTLALIGVALVALLAVVVAPLVLAFFPVDAATGWLLEAVRWLVTLGVLLVAAGLLYRYGPNRRQRIPLISPGAAVAVLVWLVASAGLSLYLSNFANYNQIYGSIGAVIAMMLWIYVSAYLLLLGAALNMVVLRIR